MENHRITRKTIIGCTAAIFGVQPSDITGPRRENLLVRARWICALLFREHDPKVSNPQIGDALGRDHTTAIHALRAGAKLARTDERFALKLDACRRKVRAWRPSASLAEFSMPERPETPEPVKRPSAVNSGLPRVVALPVVEIDHRQDDPIEVRMMRESVTRATIEMARRMGSERAA